jgi:hypothetical protein
MFKEGNAVICRGMWAMTDEQHTKPDLTSEFEFRLVNANDPEAITSGAFPVGGLYQGWFKLRKSPPLKGFDKVDDKGITITFENMTEEERKAGGGSGNDGVHAGNEDGGKFNADADMKVSGKGSNKFGSFTLKGSLNSKSGVIVMYREYVPKPIKIRVKTEPRPKTTAMNSDLPATPREGAGRVRKQSSLVTDFETGGMPLAKVAKTGMSKEQTKQHRLNLQFQKCGALLDELVKHPKAAYFLEPVDPIKLNIPDYALIVTQPMDFTTIRSNLGSSGGGSGGGKYKAPSEFAEHVRLIFKNAIAYNSLRDNPVHIAAREMAKVFEERYRAIVASFSSSMAGSGGGGGGGGNKPSKPKSKSGKAGGGGAGVGAGGIMGMGVPGMMGMAALPPQPKKKVRGPNPPALTLSADGGLSMIQMQEMQRKMMEMQSEMLMLRTAVQQEKVKGMLDQKQSDSKNPLTLKEKEELIASINRLPPDNMEKIISIIQEATPAGKESDDDIEIPLDELDTHTLRKLQSYVFHVTGKGGGGGGAGAGGGGRAGGPGGNNTEGDINLFQFP